MTDLLETLGRVQREISANRQKMKPLNDLDEIKIYDCSLCKDSGYELFKKDGYEFMRECFCGLVQKKIIENRLHFAAIPEVFKGLLVSNFQTDCYSTKENQELALMAKTLCQRYVEQYQSIQEDEKLKGKGLYFHSTVKGSGKTRLAVSLANDLLLKYSVRAKFTTTIQILDEIKASWDRKKNYYSDQEDQTEQKLIQDIIDTEFLIIDDIGVEKSATNSSTWIDERFYNIIDGRLREQKTTIFTSNCEIERLKLDERITNRIMKMVTPVPFPNESIRLKEAKKENSSLLDRLLG